MTFLQFIIFLLATFTVSSIKYSDGHPNPTGISLDLVHRDHVLSPHLSRFDRLRQMLHRDMQILKRRSNSVRRQTIETASTTLTPEASTTLTPGRNFGIGQYILKVNIGTPPQKVLMIPDTASDLNMLKCSYKGKTMSTGPIFYADNSSSFAAINCTSDMCTKNLTYLVKPDSKKNYCVGGFCAYSKYGYTSNLSTSGIFANETFTFPENQVLLNISIGCSTTGHKLEEINGTHGILSISNNPMSFPAMASRLFGNVFSLCLVDHLSTTSSGIFTLGRVPQGDMNYTALDISTFESYLLYGLNIKTVYVGGNPMEIDSGVWNNMNDNGGTIVDTGTSVTVLNSKAYAAITGALNQSLSTFMSPVHDDDFKFCYNSTGYKDLLVPKLKIEFAGGAMLEPPSKSYLIEVGLGVKCLGFNNAGKTYTTIGNILLQEHLVMFDVDNSKFWFVKSDCKFRS